MGLTHWAEFAVFVGGAEPGLGEFAGWFGAGVLDG